MTHRWPRRPMNRHQGAWGVVALVIAAVWAGAIALDLVPDRDGSPGQARSGGTIPSADPGETPPATPPPSVLDTGATAPPVRPTPPARAGAAPPRGGSELPPPADAVRLPMPVAEDSTIAPPVPPPGSAAAPPAPTPDVPELAVDAVEDTLGTGADLVEAPDPEGETTDDADDALPAGDDDGHPGRGHGRGHGRGGGHGGREGPG
jgi:hypothetical protein